jgi:6-phosphogluconolactonase
MHTASLFPEADQLKEAMAPKAPVLMAMRAPGAPEPRITLSARVLDGALAKHIVIFGDEKRKALEVARHKNPLDAPVAAVLTGATVHWAP